MRRSLAVGSALSACIGFGCSGKVLQRRTGGDAAPLQLLDKTKAEATAPLSDVASRAAEDNGFVIVPSVTAPSFHFGYSALFEEDQPVYITADAVLHAVHASFDDILIDLEHEVLIGELRVFLDELRDQLPQHAGSSGQARAEVDLIVSVAKGLLNGGAVAPVAGADPQRVREFTEAAIAAEGAKEIHLFGEPMLVDFSMMKPRGHYTRSPELERYFRALSWLGRIELRLAHTDGPGPLEVKREALAGALVLWESQTPRAQQAWARIDRATQLMVGPADSMSLPQFAGAAKTIGLTWESVGSLDAAQILNTLGPLSQQRINTQMVRQEEKTIPLWVFGQRYIADSHLLSTTSYDSLPIVEPERAMRMMPNTLDIAAAIFGNPEADTLLAAEYERYPALRPTLERMEREFDAAGPGLWEGSMSHLWLDALRTLSGQAPTGLPKVMTSPAWRRRVLNTQLASWAERRHDTILYAKQSVTVIAGCSYPKAYVDPYPEFFARLVVFAEHGKTLADDLQLDDDGAMKQYFERLAAVMSTLRQIASNERQGLPMTPDHLDFVNHAVSIHGERVGSGSDVSYTVGGWLADIYYRNESAKFHRPTIVDVHTQPTDDLGNLVGKVLHAATGFPQLIEVRIDGIAYRGFVSSYAEVITENFERLDDDWVSTQARGPGLKPMPWMNDIAPPR
ncbi:MAG: DUF3160 domain-containing protein [Nannocystales bacterium]